MRKTTKQYIPQSSGYSSWFILFSVPLIFGAIKLKFKLYIILCISATIIKYIPDVVIENMIIFIILSFSNLIAIKIAVSNLTKTNKFSPLTYYKKLKEEKLSFTEIILNFYNLLVFVIIFWVKNKKNLLLYYISLVIIFILISNIFRLPIFIILGPDIFNSFYLYSYVMFGTLLPISYIGNVISIKHKTNLWDFSFKSLNEKITFSFMLLFLFSLFISYSYIRPFLIFYLNSLFKIIWSLFVFNFILVNPNMTVEDIFEYYRRNFTKDEIVAQMESIPPRLSFTNGRDYFAYSPGRWITPIRFSQNFYDIFNRTCMKAPSIPLSLYKPYFTNDIIAPMIISVYNNQRENHNFYLRTLPLFTCISYYYFPDYRNWIEVNNGGWNIQINYQGLYHCTFLSRSSDEGPPDFIIKRIPREISMDISHGPTTISKFIVLWYRKFVTFAEYKPGFHAEYRFKDSKDGRTSFSGILGLVATRWGVEVVPQKDIFNPQLVFYDITDMDHAFAIHMIFKYIAFNPQGTERDANLNVINFNEDTIDITEPPEGGWKTVGFKLRRNGQLIR